MTTCSFPVEPNVRSADSQVLPGSRYHTQTARRPERVQNPVSKPLSLQGRMRSNSLTGFPTMPHLQSRPTDDLIYRPSLTGAGNQGQEGSGRRIPAAGRLRWTGQRGRALLQGSPWPRSAGGDCAGARSVSLPLLRVPVWETELELVSHQKAERCQTRG